APPAPPAAPRPGTTAPAAVAPAWPAGGPPSPWVSGCWGARARTPRSCPGSARPPARSGCLAVGRGVGGRQRVLRHIDQRREGGRVRHRELGEHAAVHLDISDFETLNEPVVGDAVRARGGVDALDPQPPEGALAVLAARVGV